MATGLNGAPAGPNLREAEIEAFLARSGWAGAQRAPLSMDASTRRYERLRLGQRIAMLMDAPPREAPPCPEAANDAERLSLGWNAISRLAASRVEAFAALAARLAQLGLSAPTVEAVDIPLGLAIVEDLGDALFARVIETGSDEAELYAGAGEVLGFVHRSTVPPRLPYPGGEWPLLDYDHLALQANTDLFVEWMPKRDLDFRLSNALFLRWERAREALIDRAMAYPRSMILRDTHAENLLWLPDRDGLRRVGLLDFQDAVMGWGEWDMSMLLHDARRDVSPAAHEAATRAWLNATGTAAEAFEERLAVLGALNIMRIMGIFARLVIRDGKPRYDQFQPRLRRLLGQALAHPALDEAQAFVQTAAPHLMEPA